MKNIFLLVLTFLFILSNSNEIKGQLPDFHTAYAKPTEANIKASKARLKKLYDYKMDHLPPVESSAFKDIYEDAYDIQLSLIDDNRIVMDPMVTAWMQSIFKEIEEANPTPIIKNALFFLTTDSDVNAYASPLGFINFNIGLLANCKNKSQVAFIICHELAHLELKHSENAVVQIYEALYSSKAKKEMRAIAKMQNGSREAAIKYYEKAMFTFSYRSRTDETSADSLAIVMLQKTKFDAEESSDVLMMLDSADIHLYDVVFDLRKFFNFPDYPFKPKWVEKQSALFGGNSFIKVDSSRLDSLKTHPDCLLRASLSEGYLKSYTPPNGINASKDDTLFLQHVLFENLSMLEKNGKLDLCLLNIIKGIQKYPENRYLWVSFFHFMNILAEAQKQHIFSTKVPISDKYHGETYQEYLRFLNGLTLKDMANINMRFMAPYVEKYHLDDDIMAEWAALHKYLGDEVLFKEQKDAFLLRFPKSKHYDRILKL